MQVGAIRAGRRPRPGPVAVQIAVSAMAMTASSRAYAPIYVRYAGDTRHDERTHQRKARMRFYAPIAKVDAEEQMVWGYASTEAEDDQGEIVTREALAAALAEYMKFANIREMHQMSAVGVAEEAAIDEHGLHVGARIIDRRAWDKVREGVYKGFSIGGKVKRRDAVDRRVITALSLTEISLVDRPANPEAVFDCWKSEGGNEMAHAVEAAHLPLQVWDCGITAHRHLVKAEAVCCLERGMDERAPMSTAELPARPPAFAAGGGASSELDKSARADDLAKLLAGAILPRLDALAKRVEEIAVTPLPPLTLARGVTGISKREDGGGITASSDDVIAALGRMSEEERTLTLIKAAHANPVRPGFNRS